MLRIRAEDPGTPDAAALIDELSASLEAITGDSGRSSFDAGDMRVAGARFVVARDTSGRAVG
ncbi:MAG: GNAT family N-acetyltransferase, partial [Pseudomonadota bacterium]|nr:GNAT family N-acetyltransferase [Pseudomonadota bacterium]